MDISGVVCGPIKVDSSRRAWQRRQRRVRGHGVKARAGSGSEAHRANKATCNTIREMC